MKLEEEGEEIAEMWHLRLRESRTRDRSRREGVEERRGRWPGLIVY